jgi:hypothetical protein
MYEQAFYISTFLKRFRRAVKSEENRNDYIIAIGKAEPESHISIAVNMHDLLESMTHNNVDIVTGVDDGVGLFDSICCC